MLNVDMGDSNPKLILIVSSNETDAKRCENKINNTFGDQVHIVLRFSEISVFEYLSLNKIDMIISCFFSHSENLHQKCKQKYANIPFIFIFDDYKNNLNYSKLLFSVKRLLGLIIKGYSHITYDNYIFLDDVFGISEIESQLFHFDGEAINFNLSIFDVFDISLQRQEIKRETIHLGTTKLDGSPDWRYHNHSFHLTACNYYYLLISGKKNFDLNIQTSLTIDAFRHALNKIRQLVIALRISEVRAGYQLAIERIHLIRDFETKRREVERKQKKLKENISDIRLSSSSTTENANSSLCRAESQLHNFDAKLKLIDSDIGKLIKDIEEISVDLSTTFKKELPMIEAEIVGSKIQALGLLLDDID